VVNPILDVPHEIICEAVNLAHSKSPNHNRSYFRIWVPENLYKFCVMTL